MVRFALAFVAVSLGLAAGAPVAAEVAAVSETGFVVKHSVVAAADKATVWKALIAPHRWWNKDHTWSGNADNLYLDAQATGCFCEKLPKPADAPADQRMGSVEHMHVVYADPQSGLLRMRGGLGPLQGEAMTGIMTIKLVSVDGGTRIDAEYAVGGLIRMKGEQIAGPVNSVLGEQFTRLAALFASATTKPE
ncbi:MULTISPECIES: SRPBCC family protein [unclassified Novosphingobium]|uniref:SRPBCC family protein n=1 Tax=unclassified Novosphingobium TaxID=2644732 RepID=UPI0025FC6B3F|nr:MULTISPECIES: SRPBCC family protein [unclassified Novosphingobium]HQV04944.1 SRPBCC family protein [Novosphingobium sp.]